MSFSKDPAFTPTLIEQLLSFAALITSFILFLSPILPGFILKQLAPLLAASIALLKWKWISATTGIFIEGIIFFKAVVESWSGQETLTISAPASEILLICLMV